MFFYNKFIYCCDKLKNISFNIINVVYFCTLPRYMLLLHLPLPASFLPSIFRTPLFSYVAERAK